MGNPLRTMISSLTSMITEEEELVIQPTSDFATEIDRARRDWINAKEYFDVVEDPDLVDYAIYQIEAAEKKYMYLLKQIKKEQNIEMQ